MILGSKPTTEYESNLAIGFKPNSSIIFSDITRTNAAPSEVWEEVAAVTEPPWAKTGFNFPNDSIVPPGLAPSSVSTTYFLTCLFSFASK